MRRMIGSPATGIAGLAQTSVSGRSRVPSPAASTSACVIHGLRSPVEDHVGDRQTALLAVADEQSAVGIEQVVGRLTAQRTAAVGDAALAAFDLDEGPHRRLVDGDDDVVGGELLAVLLIPEPDAEAELLQHAQEQRPVADAVSSSSRSFMTEGCTGPLNVRRLVPDSIRTRNTEPRSRSDPSAVSSRQSSWSRRPRSGVAPAAITAARAASGSSNAA